MKENKISKEIAKDRNAGTSFIRNCPTHLNLKNKCKNEYINDGCRSPWDHVQVGIKFGRKHVIHQKLANFI